MTHRAEGDNRVSGRTARRIFEVVKKQKRPRETDSHLYLGTTSSKGKGDHERRVLDANLAGKKKQGEGEKRSVCYPLGTIITKKQGKGKEKEWKRGNNRQKGDTQRPVDIEVKRARLIGGKTS